MPNKVWDEITNPFPNFNSATVEDWEWISYFILLITGYVITYPCSDQTYVGKMPLVVCQGDTQHKLWEVVHFHGHNENLLCHQ